jgi:hypothetical protein
MLVILLRIIVSVTVSHTEVALSLDTASSASFHLENQHLYFRPFRQLFVGPSHVGHRLAINIVHPMHPV